MDEALPVTLPDYFFKTLSDIKENLDKNNEKVSITEKQAEYDSNILKSPTENKNTTNIVPTFSSEIGSVYEKIGAAFFKGGTEIFLESWKKLEASNKYRAAREKTVPLKDNIINVNIPRQPTIPDKEKSNPWWLLPGLVAAGFGMWLGNTSTGQIFESILQLPKFLLTNNLTKILDSKLVKGISGAVFNIFDDIIAWVGNQGKLGGFIGKIAKPIKSIFGLFGKGSLKLLSSVGSALKVFPIIGSALGLYNAYQDFENGDIFKGTMNVITALLPFFGPMGIGVSVGLNLLQELWSMDYGMAGTTSLVLKGATKINYGIAGRALKLMSNFMPDIFGKLGKFVFKKIPFIGSAIGIGIGMEAIDKGEYLKGSLDVLSGIASLVPGYGTAIAILIDLLNLGLNETEVGQKLQEGTKSFKFEGSGSAFLDSTITILGNCLESIGTILLNGFDMALDWVKDLIGIKANGLKEKTSKLLGENMASMLSDLNTFLNNNEKMVLITNFASKNNISTDTLAKAKEAANLTAKANLGTLGISYEQTAQEKNASIDELMRLIYTKDEKYINERLEYYKKIDQDSKRKLESLEYETDKEMDTLDSITKLNQKRFNTTNFTETPKIESKTTELLHKQNNLTSELIGVIKTQQLKLSNITNNIINGNASSNSNTSVAPIIDPRSNWTTLALT